MKNLLNGYIEMDEVFLKGTGKGRKEGLALKPVRELDRQVTSIVAVSTTPVATDKYKKGRPITKPGYLKMSVVQSLSKKILALKQKQW